MLELGLVRKGKILTSSLPPWHKALVWLLICSWSEVQTSGLQVSAIIPQLNTTTLYMIVLYDFNAKIGKENIFVPTVGKFSLHREALQKIATSFSAQPNCNQSTFRPTMAKYFPLQAGAKSVFHKETPGV